MNPHDPETEISLIATVSDHLAVRPRSTEAGWNCGDQWPTRALKPDDLPIDGTHGRNNNDTVTCEEVFSPNISVLTYVEEVDVLTKAKDTDFGTATGVGTENLGRANLLLAGWRRALFVSIHTFSFLLHLHSAATS